MKLDLQYFPHFIRANLKGKVHDFTNPELIEVGKEFQIYLNEAFNGKEEKLKSISDISPRAYIENYSSPFHVNGYNSALVVHFCEFVRIQGANES